MTRATAREWPGEETFAGRIVHPAVLAGGPRLARQEGRGDRQRRDGRDPGARAGREAAQVTMVQRSPSYIVSRPSVDFIAEWLKRWLPLTRRLRADAVEERAADRSSSIAGAAAAGAGRGQADRSSPRPTSAHGSTASRFLAGLQALGPAPVPGAGRRPVRRDPRGQGVGRHRGDRALHPGRAPAGDRRRASTRTSSSPRPG